MVSVPGRSGAHSIPALLRPQNCNLRCIPSRPGSLHATLRRTLLMASAASGAALAEGIAS